MNRVANKLTAETHRRPYVCEADWQARWTIVESLARVIEDAEGRGGAE